MKKARITINIENIPKFYYQGKLMRSNNGDVLITFDYSDYEDMIKKVDHILEEINIDNTIKDCREQLRTIANDEYTYSIVSSRYYIGVTPNIDYTNHIDI
jgi:spore coat polysaccharide biosynthesis predicted glycosyltransferase SpsG